MISEIKNRLFSMIGKVIAKQIKDDSDFQKIIVESFKGEIKELEIIQPYGFAYNPPKGSEGVALFPNGSRDNGFILMMGNRKLRLKNLSSGEVALYDDKGNKIHIKTSGEIEIKASSKVVVNSPSVDIGEGALESVLNGEAFQTWANNHTHLGNLGVPTGKPMAPSDNLSSSIKAKT